MEQLTGKPKEEIIKDLQCVIFRIPATEPAQYVTADEYLSGTDFPCDIQAVACSGNGGNHQIHHPPLVVKGYILPSVEVAGNLIDLFRADGFHRQLGYLRQKFLFAPVQFRYLHIHIGEQNIVWPPSDCPPAFQSRCPHGEVPLAGRQF